MRQRQRRCPQIFRIDAFQRKKTDFPFDPSGIPGQLPVAPDHSVARDQDADRIVPDRSADRPCRNPDSPSLPGKFRGDPSVGGNTPAGNLTQDLPDRKAKGRTGRTKQRKFSRITPLKITIQPGLRLFQHGQDALFLRTRKSLRKMFLSVEPQAGQPFSLAGKSNPAQR